MLNPGLAQLSPQCLLNYDRAAALAGVLALVIGTAGCASSQPAPLLVQHQAGVTSGDNADRELSLKMVTFNVWGLPSWLTGAPGGRYPRIARELARLDPDIVFLQEAWTAKARKSVPEGPWWIARASGQRSFFQQSGLVVMSRYPIVGGEFYPFNRAAFPDRFVNKGVLKVTVLLADGERLNLWDVHLQDGHRERIRSGQIRKLLSLVQSAQDGQLADLVGGDFNCTPESPLYRELKTRVGPSVQELDGKAPFVTWDNLCAKPGAGRTLDYIFVRARTPLPLPKATSQAVFTAPDLRQRLSDHFGVEAVVILNPVSRLAGVGEFQPPPALLAVTPP